MLFNSMQFLLFLPVVTVIYYLIPRKIRYIWLLLTSYYFYMCWNQKYALLILTSTIITYLSGLAIQRVRKKENQGVKWDKIVVLISVISNLGILVFFKYFNWIIDNINMVFGVRIVSPFSLLLPVGISFYTFQALSYTIDVYRGEIEAEKNFARYALFVSFFPQLVAGPIERSKNLLHQLDRINDQKISYKKIRDGLCLMLYGFFLKLVIADRVSILVDTVFDNYQSYGFIELTVAAVFFAIQILCDFNGYTTIAQGSAKILGIELMDNFHQPYLSTSIKEFWRRWHISLTSWFTDYVYKPLGGNRKGFLRKEINTFIVFFISGLWHGASWHYVIWGLLHGMYLNIENWIHELRKRKHKKDKKQSHFKRLVSLVVTFVLVDIAWVFFRAPSCKAALNYFHQMTTSLRTTSLFSIGFLKPDWLIAVLSIAIMLVVDILHEKGVSIRRWLYGLNIWARWIIYFAALWGILLFGIYGVDYDASQFIYFQF